MRESKRVARRTSGEPTANRPSMYDDSSQRVTSTVLPLHDREVVVDPSLRDLLLRTEAPITARPIWWSAWARAYHYDPMVITLPDRGAAAPLAVRRTARRTQIQMLGGSSADHARLLATDGDPARRLADLVVDRLASLTGPWHVRLAQLPAQDAVAQRLAEVMPYSHWRLAPELASPYVVLRPGAGVDDYLGRTSRKGHRRTVRGFAAAGGTVSHTQDPNHVMALLPELARVRRARDHRCGRVSDLDSEQGYAFWSSVLTDHSAAGELEVALAWIGDRLVGYDVILLDGRTERLWDGRVAPEAERLSVGRMLQDVALARALDRGSVELDLMRGVTPAKLRLATDVRACSVFEAWSSSYQRTRTLASRRAIAAVKEVRDSNEVLDGWWRRAKRRTLLRHATANDSATTGTGGPR